jgi:hypothetical protein
MAIFAIFEGVNQRCEHLTSNKAHVLIIFVGMHAPDYVFDALNFKEDSIRAKIRLLEKRVIKKLTSFDSGVRVRAVPAHTAHDFGHATYLDDVRSVVLVENHAYERLQADCLKVHIFLMPSHTLKDQIHARFAENMCIEGIVVSRAIYGFVSCTQFLGRFQVRRHGPQNHPQSVIATPACCPVRIRQVQAPDDYVARMYVCMYE